VRPQPTRLYLLPSPFSSLVVPVSAWHLVQSHADSITYSQRRDPDHAPSRRIVFCCPSFFQIANFLILNFGVALPEADSPARRLSLLLVASKEPHSCASSAAWVFRFLSHPLSQMCRMPYARLDRRRPVALALAFDAFTRTRRVPVFQDRDRPARLIDTSVAARDYFRTP
jgi:hypothetical protein